MVSSRAAAAVRAHRVNMARDLHQDECKGLAPVRVGSLSADVDITPNSTLAPAAVPAPRQNGAIGGPQAATAARPGGAVLP